MPTRPRPPARRAYAKHGLTTLKAAVKGLGGRVIDRRTTLGRALDAWRAELVEDLGGHDTISTQQAAVVDLAVRSKLLLESIDAWLLTQPSLVNQKRRTLLPAVKERQTLADSLLRQLTALGLARISRPPLDLNAYLAARDQAAAPEAPGGPADPEDQAKPTPPADDAPAGQDGAEAGA